MKNFHNQLEPNPLSSGLRETLNENQLHEKKISRTKGWKLFLIAFLSVAAIHFTVHAFFLYQTKRIMIFPSHSAMRNEFNENPDFFRKNKHYDLIGNANPYYKFMYFPGRYCLVEPVKLSPDPIFNYQVHPIDKFICPRLFPPPYGFLLPFIMIPIPSFFLFGYIVAVIITGVIFLPFLVIAKVRKERDYVLIFLLALVINVVIAGVVEGSFWFWAKAIEGAMSIF